MDQQVVIRRVRIAATVFFGVVAVTLGVLWITSYWRFVTGQGRFAELRSIAFYALDGSATLSTVRDNYVWKIESWDATGFPAMRQVRDRSLAYTFRIPSNSSAVTIQLPLWFPALACGLFAAAPWLRYRFSLRTMLFATTLVAVVLGLVGYAVR